MESSCRDSDSRQRLNDYLASNHWKSVCRIVKHRDGFCQVCFDSGARHVIPLNFDNFDRLGVLLPVQCVSLCTDCLEKLNRVPQDFE